MFALSCFLCPMVMTITITMMRMVRMMAMEMTGTMMNVWRY